MARKIQFKRGGITLKATRSQMKEVNRETYDETAGWIHRKLVPKRFTRRGASELGFQPRKPVTVRIKSKLYGHNLPNVASGEARSLSKVKNIRTTATSKGAKSRIKLPRKLNFQNKSPGSAKPGEEVTRVSGRESRQVEKRIADTKIRKLNKLARNRG